MKTLFRICLVLLVLTSFMSVAEALPGLNWAGRMHDRRVERGAPTLFHARSGVGGGCYGSTTYNKTVTRSTGCSGSTSFINPSPSVIVPMPMPPKPTDPKKTEPKK